jgi:hypothetical protein
LPICAICKQGFFKIFVQFQRTPEQFNSGQYLGIFFPNDFPGWDFWRLNGFFRLNFMEIEVKFYVPVQRRIVIFRHKNFSGDVSSKSHSRKPSSKAAFRPYPEDITATYSTLGAGLVAATSGYYCRDISLFARFQPG